MAEENPPTFRSSRLTCFKPLDGGIALSEDEIKGRNTWNLWCGGNEQFWDRMSRESFGLMDLLKTIDSRNRGTRFKEMGLINQPGFQKASKPDENGIWLDEAVSPEDAAIDPKVYGRPTGIMGFRLFPNPAFDDRAKKNWDGERYYSDANYAVGSETRPPLPRRRFLRIVPHRLQSAFTRRPIPRIRAGRIFRPPSATSTSAKAARLPTT